MSDYELDLLPPPDIQEELNRCKNLSVTEEPEWVFRCVHFGEIGWVPERGWGDWPGMMCAACDLRQA